MSGSCQKGPEGDQGEIQIEPSGVPKALLLPAVVFVSVTAAQTSTWNSFKEKWEGSWDWPIDEIVIWNMRNSGWFFVDTWTSMNHCGSSLANLGWKPQRRVPSSDRGGTHQLAPVWEIAPFQPGKSLTGTEGQPEGLLVLLLHVEAGLLALQHAGASPPAAEEKGRNGSWDCLSSQGFFIVFIYTGSHCYMYMRGLGKVNKFIKRKDAKNNIKSKSHLLGNNDIK